MPPPKDSLESTYQTFVNLCPRDLIQASGGDDTVDGLEGNDQLEGGAGNNIPIGSTGSDRLIGSKGNDTLTGGSGADQFRFLSYDIVDSNLQAPTHSIDTITDLNFSSGDVIVLSHFAAGTFVGSDVNGQLDLINTDEGPGSGTNIRNWAGLVDLVRSSSSVSAARDASSNTLLLVVSTLEGSTQTIAILNGWPQYAALTNTAPNASNDDVLVVEDSVATGNVLVNDIDSDPSDSLRVAALGSESVAVGGTRSLAAKYGTLTLNADGTFRYSPDSAAAQALSLKQPAVDSFMYTIVDESGSTATATLTFSVVGENDRPVVYDLAAGVTENGAAVTLMPDFTDVDAGDTHSISVDTSGTVGRVVLNADGSFSYDASARFESLRAGEAVNDTFTYTVTDAAGASATATVTMTIVGENDGPVAKALTANAMENGAAMALAPDFVDPDAGDAHTINIDVTGTKGSVTLSADGNFVYDANGKFESLKAGAIAIDSFRYTVTDSAGANSTATVTMTIFGQNDGPIAKALSANAAESGPPVVLGV